MSPAPRPEAIESRFVFHVYACSAIPAGIIVYMWPLLTSTSAGSSTWLAPGRIVAAAVTALGCCAASFAAIDDPIARRRGLVGFAYGHMLFGTMLLSQSIGAVSAGLPPLVGWAPLIVGLALLYLAITGPGTDFRQALPPLDLGKDVTAGATMFVVRNKPGVEFLRSQYEEQIRQAARLEERARLARDLHDAVKQQLFVIQTAAATAQARFDTDTEGTRAAVDQVRSAAREAMSEMEAMLEQLQSAPLENAGLVASLKKHSEALGFRTGAQVAFELGTLPPDSTLDPAARRAIFRAAQEALSNVGRHARAQNVGVSLAAADGQLVLTVQDDGSGFRAEGRPRGMGMANMAARAADVGGSLDVASVPGRGTTVRFSVPIEQQRSPAPYVRRALVWGIVLIAAVGYVMLSAFHARPWGAAVALIAGMAVARYALAVYRLRRRDAPA